MTYRIMWSIKASKQLEKLDRAVTTSISKKLESITENPFRNVSKIEGNSEGGLYKLRIGDYRALIEINKMVLIILVIKVGHRKNIYEGS